MDYDSSDDISWLTQQPLQKGISHHDSSDSEIDVVGNVVSLESENVRAGPSSSQSSNSSEGRNSRILYDNVMIEDISSDDEIGQM